MNYLRGFTCHFVMGISQYPIIIPNFSNHGQIYSFQNPWEGLKVYVRRKRGLQRITEFSRYCICKLLPCTLSLIINLNSSPSYQLQLDVSIIFCTEMQSPQFNYLSPFHVHFYAIHISIVIIVLKVFTSVMFICNIWTNVPTFIALVQLQGASWTKWRTASISSIFGVWQFSTGTKGHVLLVSQIQATLQINKSVSLRY